MSTNTPTAQAVTTIQEDWDTRLHNASFMSYEGENEVATLRETIACIDPSCPDFTETMWAAEQLIETEDNNMDPEIPTVGGELASDIASEIIDIIKVLDSGHIPSELR